MKFTEGQISLAHFGYTNVWVPDPHPPTPHNTPPQAQALGRGGGSTKGVCQPGGLAVHCPAPRCAGQLPVGQHAGRYPKDLGEAAVGSDKRRRRQLSVYCDRYAHFFRREFFVQKAFEALNAEHTPEHSGFRHSCATLYAAYRGAVLRGSGPEEFAEYCYRDEHFTEFDAAAAARFLAWLGVIRPTPADLEAFDAGAASGAAAALPGPAAHAAPDHAAEADGAPSGAAAARPGPAAHAAPDHAAEAAEAPPVEECPICLEMRPDVHVLPHWQPVGDVSAHRMCGACRAAHEAEAAGRGSGQGRCARSATTSCTRTPSSGSSGSSWEPWRGAEGPGTPTRWRRCWSAGSCSTWSTRAGARSCGAWRGWWSRTPRSGASCGPPCARVASGCGHRGDCVPVRGDGACRGAAGGAGDHRCAERCGGGHPRAV